MKVKVSFQAEEVRGKGGHRARAPQDPLLPYAFLDWADATCLRLNRGMRKMAAPHAVVLGGRCMPQPLCRG